MKELLRLFTELARMAQGILEIKKRRLLIDELEKIENEIEDIEKDIDRLRHSGQPDAANLLLKRQARRARFRIWLDSSAKGGDLQSPP